MIDHIITPAEADAVKSASLADSKEGLALRKRRFQRAVQWLDDGQWDKNGGIWKRSYEEQKLTFTIGSDTINLVDLRSVEKTESIDDGFNWCFTVMHETEGGFGPNLLKDLERTRAKRQGNEELAPPELLAFRKLNPLTLNSREKRWNEAIPPSRELIEQMVGYDQYIGKLYRVNPQRDTTDLVFGQFVELNGAMYAVWRVCSMLMFGNPNGYADKVRWRELLKAHPKIDKPLVASTPRVATKKRYKKPTTPPKPVPIDRDAPEKEQRFDSMVAAGRLEKQLIHESKKAEQVRKRLASKARSKTKVKAQVVVTPKKPDQQELALQRILDKRKKEEQAERIRGFKLRAKEWLAAERKAERHE